MSYSVKPFLRRAARYGPHVVFAGLVVACGNPAGINPAGRRQDPPPEPAARPEVAPAPTAPSPPKDRWATAPKEAATLGGMRVRVTKTSIGAVTLRRFPAQQSGEELLLVHLAVENTSEDKKATFHGWGQSLDVAFSGRDRPTMTDDLGNSYALKHGSFSDRVDGQAIGGESVYPGRGVEDLAVFEPPVKRAKTLRLELPGEGLDVPGRFRFLIPVETIKGP